jgi:hypothetical protein
MDSTRPRIAAPAGHVEVGPASMALHSASCPTPRPPGSGSAPAGRGCSQRRISAHRAAIRQSAPPPAPKCGRYSQAGCPPQGRRQCSSSATALPMAPVSCPPGAPSCGERPPICASPSGPRRGSRGRGGRGGRREGVGGEETLMFPTISSSPWHRLTSTLLLSQLLMAAPPLSISDLAFGGPSAPLVTDGPRRR